MMGPGMQDSEILTTSDNGALMKSETRLNGERAELDDSGDGDSSAYAASEAAPAAVCHDGHVSIALLQSDLWQTFSRSTNEMIVTRSGRRMFPVYAVTASGLNPKAMYSVFLDFEVVGSQRWKFVNRHWVPGGRADPPIQSRYKHPDSPNYGAHWMSKPIQFSKIKLTNKNNSEQIVLNSLHNYEPRLHVIPEPGHSDGCPAATAAFPQTQFIAVTAYQNEAITELKISHNPFAKSFKDSISRKEECGQNSPEATSPALKRETTGIKLRSPMDVSQPLVSRMVPSTALLLKTEPQPLGMPGIQHFPPHQPSALSYRSQLTPGQQMELSSALRGQFDTRIETRTTRAMSLPARSHQYTRPVATTQEPAPSPQQLGAGFSPGTACNTTFTSAGFPYTTLPPPPYHSQSFSQHRRQVIAQGYSPSGSPPSRPCRRTKSTSSMPNSTRLHPYPQPRGSSPSTMDASPLSTSPMSLSPLVGSPEPVSPLTSSNDVRFTHPLTALSGGSADQVNSLDSDTASTVASLSSLSTMLEEPVPVPVPVPAPASMPHMHAALCNATQAQAPLSAASLAHCGVSADYLLNGFQNITPAPLEPTPIPLVGGNPFTTDYSGVSLSNGTLPYYPHLDYNNL